jgi:hypothetical protein
VAIVRVLGNCVDVRGLRIAIDEVARGVLGIEEVEAEVEVAAAVAVAVVLRRVLRSTTNRQPPSTPLSLIRHYRPRTQLRAVRILVADLRLDRVQSRPKDRSLRGKTDALNISHIKVTFRFFRCLYKSEFIIKGILFVKE